MIIKVNWPTASPHLKEKGFYRRKRRWSWLWYSPHNNFWTLNIYVKANLNQQYVCIDFLFIWPVTRFKQHLAVYNSLVVSKVYMRRCQLMGQFLDCMKTKIPTHKLKYLTHIQLNPQINIFNIISTTYITCIKKLPIMVIIILIVYP